MSGSLVVLTGASGSGKTTIALEVERAQRSYGEQTLACCGTLGFASQYFMQIKDDSTKIYLT